MKTFQWLQMFLRAQVYRIQYREGNQKKRH